MAVALPLLPSSGASSRAGTPTGTPTGSRPRLEVAEKTVPRRIGTRASSLTQTQSGFGRQASGESASSSSLVIGDSSGAEATAPPRPAQVFDPDQHVPRRRSSRTETEPARNHERHSEPERHTEPVYGSERGQRAVRDGQRRSERNVQRATASLEFPGGHRRRSEDRSLSRASSSLEQNNGSQRPSWELPSWERSWDRHFAGRLQRSSSSLELPQHNQGRRRSTGSGIDPLTDGLSLSFPGFPAQRRRSEQPDIQRISTWHNDSSSSSGHHGWRAAPHEQGGTGRHGDYEQASPPRVPQLPRRGSTGNIPNLADQGSEEPTLPRRRRPDLSQLRIPCTRDVITIETMSSRSPPIEEGSERESSSDDEARAGQSPRTVPLGTQDAEFSRNIRQDPLGRLIGERFNDHEAQRMRIAFHRFAKAGDPAELERGQLHDILVHLGYLTSSEAAVKKDAEQIARSMESEMGARKLSDDSFGYEPFKNFVALFAKAEHTALMAKITACMWRMKSVHGNTPTEAAQLRLERIQAMLQSMGLAVRVEEVEGAVKMAELQLDQLDHRGLLRLVAALRFSHGFTEDEVGMARKSFDTLARLPRRRQGGDVKASEIGAGLLDFAGPYCIDYVRQLVAKLADKKDAPGVCFYEFTVWAGHLKNMDMLHLQSMFEAARKDCDGKISATVVSTTLATQSGFTLLGNEADAILCKSGLEHGQQTVDFSAFVRFVRACRENHGFIETELEEISMIYSRFADEQTDTLEIDLLEDVMRSLGDRSDSLDDVDSNIKRLNFRNQGTLNRHVFLALVRLQREQLIDRVRRTFDARRGKQDELPIGKLVKALHFLGVELQNGDLEEINGEDGFCEAVGFEKFMTAVLCGRRHYAAKVRRQAGFHTSTFEVLRRAFASQDEGNTGFISLGQLLLMLSEANVPMNTREQREALFRTSAIARRRAAGDFEALSGKLALEGEQRTDVSRLEYLHLMRILIRKRESADLASEKEAVEQTKFSLEEVDNFHKAFRRMRNIHFKDVASTTCGDAVARFVTTPKCTLWSALSFIAPEESKQMEVETRMRSLAGKDSNELGLDFARFLYLMRWVLDRQKQEDASIAVGRFCREDFWMSEVSGETALDESL